MDNGLDCPIHGESLTLIRLAQQKMAGKGFTIHFLWFPIDFIVMLDNKIIDKVGIFFLQQLLLFQSIDPNMSVIALSIQLTWRFLYYYFLIIVTCLIFDRKSISQWRGEETHSGVTAKPGVGAQWARSHAQRERKGCRGARSSHQTTRAAQEWARFSVQSWE